MSAFDEGKVRREHGRFATKAYGDSGQLSLEDSTGQALDGPNEAPYGRSLEPGYPMHEADMNQIARAADAKQVDLDQAEYDPAWGEGVRRYVDEGGHVFYRRGDELQREDGAAYISPEGTQVWYRDDLQHRLDGPDVIYSDGSVGFWIDGERVEPDDPRLRLG